VCWLFFQRYVFMLLEEMDVFCIPLYSLHLALICFSQKFAKGGDCWVFVLAALLLKQISLFVLLEPMFQHEFRHFCKMLDLMFQHPDTVQCAWVHAYLYASPSLFNETIFPYLIDQATRISLQNQLWNISEKIFIF